MPEQLYTGSHLEKGDQFSQHGRRGLFKSITNDYFRIEEVILSRD